jgi:hypothetical protein
MLKLNGEIEKNNNFYKRTKKKKLEIKIMRVMLENIILSI